MLLQYLGRGKIWFQGRFIGSIIQVLRMGKGIAYEVL